MVKAIEISKIYSSGNVRNEVDNTLLDLMASIEKNGLLQPIVVRVTEKGYEVVAGHRRLEAVKRLGEPFIDCNILEDVNTKERFVMQLEENLQRKEMSAYEIVCAADKLTEEYGCTDTQISAMLHKPSNYIANQRYAVRLLEKEYKDGIPEEKKKLSANVIMAMNQKKTRATVQSEKIYGKGFTVQKKGHTYQIYCTDFNFEDLLNKLIQENK
ncbi:MAG: ParB/RepB/Spo0J family partition protein [Treponema sp.]|nr:ParB/RepB/Spo0J family partition protein [Treponema sp.]